MKDNESIIKTWLSGKEEKNDSLMTDGNVLLYSPRQEGWNYTLELGYYSPMGVYFIYNYTKTGRFISLAVSRIVAAAVRLGARPIKPGETT